MPRRLSSALAAASVLVATAPAVAKPVDHVIDADAKARVTVDWTRGLVIATGAAAADIRAPSPEISRVSAERKARDRARAALEAAARELPWAGEGTVGSRVDAADGAAERLAAELVAARDLSVDYGSDGSTVVELALPIEAVRRAVVGTPALPPGLAAGDAPTALIVEAADHVRAPALGAVVAAGDERYAGPVVYVRSSKVARADSRIGERAVVARARGLDGGVVTVDAEPAVIASARRSGALVVIVLGGRRR